MSHEASSGGNAPLIHPLESEWVWAYKPTVVYKQQTASDWLSDYKRLYPNVIDSVELFWQVFNHLPRFTKLDYGNIYALFKEGIDPVWEHPANEKGYSIILYMNKYSDQEAVEKIYLYSLLVVIGGAASFAPDLNGCTMERKTGGNKAVFWFKRRGPITEQKAHVKELLHLLELHPKDVFLLDDRTGRVDWRDRRYGNYQVAVRCVPHQGRVSEVAKPSQHKRSNSRTAPPPPPPNAWNRKRGHR